MLFSVLFYFFFRVIRLVSGVAMDVNVLWDGVQLGCHGGFRVKIHALESCLCGV